VTAAISEAHYDQATLMIATNPMPGSYRRTTRTAQLRGLATLRLGVRWIPTLQLGIGAGARLRTAAIARTASFQGEILVVPDDQDAEISMDMIAAVRIGFEHRFARRWSIGVSAGATECFGLGRPDIQFVDAAISLGYRWYPLW
jgi:hypothetical protein